ncbi:MAG: methyltransferase domain-containing protein [Salinivenus sp.]
MSSSDNVQKRRTRGPIDILADHVSSEWWRDLFDETYLLTDSDVLSPSITRHEVDIYVDRGKLTPKDRILDLCCGQGRHALELARRGFDQVRGIDQSAFLIEAARDAAQRQHWNGSFDRGDARDLPYDDNAFDVVLLLGNSFGYFDTTRDDQTVLQEVRRVLRPGGRVLLDLTDGDYTRNRFSPRSWEWASDQHLVCRERELADDGTRLVAREIVIHADQGIQNDQFYSERLYGRREISALLRHSGFDALAFSDMKGRSERDQDLGMMAHRFITTAQLPGEASSAPSNNRQNGTSTNRRHNDNADSSPSPPPTSLYRSPVKNLEVTLPRYVAVVLGDPRRPDETKLGGTFGEEDYDVVNKLQDALGLLSGYEFIYFNDHDSLVDDLRTYGDAVDLVFNLCDEGLRNDPRQELHLPALLETFDIPYTGAGPQCLAHCYDKSMIRGVAAEMGIPVADGYFLRPDASLPTPLPLSYPVLVKPNAADNSAGMTTDCIAENRSELQRAIQSVRNHVGPNENLLVEEFLTGADLTFGMIGNPPADLRSLPITEDDYSRLPDDLPRFCGFDAKRNPDSPYWTDVEPVPANLPDDTRKQIQRDSRLLFERLGCRDYARFDWRLDGEGAPHLLEANPNPGWCWDGHLVEAAAFDGTSYSDVLEGILDAAYRRLKRSVPQAQ